MKIQLTRSAKTFLIGLIFLLGISGSIQAQSWTQYDQGTPPQHSTGVSPLGSYISNEIGTVNLNNGALNIHLPIATVGGRGFSVPISLNYSSKVWSVGKDTDWNPWNGNEAMVAYATYGESGSWIGYYNNLPGAGWSIGGVPVMTKRFIGVYACDTGQGYQTTLTKLSASMPDGSEIEFRDDSYDGAPRNWPIGQCTLYNDVSRSLRWHATDGSGAIFLFDNSNLLSGTLITDDGTRYRFDSMFTPAVSVTDRNGNQITINRSTDPNNPGHVTVDHIDQLGRSTKVELNAPDPANGAVTLAALVTVKGYQGTAHYYKIRTDTIGNLIRSDFNYTGSQILTGYTDTFSKCYQGGQPPAATYLFPDSYCTLQQRIDNQAQISQLELPDGRSLNFKYNLYGEVAEVVLPTAGKLQYDYSSAGSLPSGNTLSIESNAQLNGVSNIDRAVTERRTYPDGSNLEGTWTYSYAPGNCSTSPCMDVKAYAGSANGTLLLNQRHYFLQPLRYLYQADYSVAGTGYSRWNTGLESRTETRDASNNVIGAVEKSWTQRSAPYYVSGEQIANDNRVYETRHYLDNGSFAKTDTFYDESNYPRANNVAEIDAYDFDGSLERRSTTSYVNGNYQSDDSIHLVSLPATQTVFDGNGAQVAQSTNEYDNYTNEGPNGNHAALLDYGTVIGHDGNYTGVRTSRGNITANGQWLNINNSFIYSYLTYDILGNPLTHKDGRGNVTSISYADNFGDGSNPGGGGVGAYGATYSVPTLLTSPPPQSGQPQQTARSQYDFWSGLLTGFRDRNSVVTQSIYDDPFDRPTQVKSALGVSGVESHAAMYYAPSTVFGITLSNNDVLTAKDQTTIDDQVLRSWTHTDGFGRTVQSWSRDPQGDDEVITTYDALSRPKQVSNPFRPSAGQSAIYATTVYDLAGRVSSVTTPDSAVVNTYYNGNQVLVKDQAGKERMNQTNALGQLTDVWEITPTDQWTVGVSFPNHGEVTSGYHTVYGFDALDNLTSVTQGAQPQRTFVYDSLKRLISVKNPEMVNGQGVQVPVTYQYDNNGNLTQKTDARGVLSTYGYDALNRTTSVVYSDGSPAVNKVYDGATNGVGRLYYQWTAAGDTTKNLLNVIDAYDAAGRPKNWRQQFWVSGNWGTPYAMSGNYDLAGHITSMGYPSGHSVSYAYDLAGRNYDFRGRLGDNSLRVYSTSITYSALGGLAQEQFGTSTPIYNKLFYNSRGQLAEIRDGLTANDTSWQRGAIINFYGDNCWGMCGGENSTTPMGNNNGNVKTQAIFVPNDDASGYEGRASAFVQGFAYDALNRLQSVQEGNWKQQYSYDRYGNRTIDQGNTYGAGVPNPYFGVDQSTNRLTPAGGYTMTYDAAGNLINDTYTGQGQRIFDAENRMTAAQGGVNGQWQNYYYDPTGQRVKRIVNGVETWLVYGVGGDLLAEYSANASPTSPQKEYGYRNGQLLITATGPGYVAENKANVSDTSKNLIARAYLEKLPWEKHNSLNGNAISDTSTPLYGPSLQQAALTRSSNTSLSLSPLVTSQAIVFASNRDGTDQIYLMNSDGTNQTRLTNNSANDDAPRWSNNNAKIVFQSDRDNPFSGMADIYSMNADGSAQTRLTSDPQDDCAPVWSPDGSKIAFQSFRNGVYYQIYVMNADGSGQVDISNSGSNDTQPSWSPDGSKIAFASDRDHVGYPSVYVMNASGSGQTRLTLDNVPYSDTQPAWSPDGSHIAFTSTRDSVTESWQETDDDGNYITKSKLDVNKEIYVMYSDGSGQTRLTTVSENDDSPAWSTSGAQIVFRSEQPRDNSDPTPQVWVMNSDGSGQLDLSGNGFGDYAPSWQQSGNSTPPPTPTPTPTPNGASPVGVHWLVTDQLGTPRMVFDESGSLTNVSRHDLLPFGEELYGGPPNAPGPGGRLIAQGYSANDGVRQHLSQKERDNETGLDYFGNRNFGSVQGRFTSTDPYLPMADADKEKLFRRYLKQPQNWNRYVYCINNPLAFVDPDGLGWYVKKGELTGHPEWFDDDKDVDKEQYEAVLFYVYRSSESGKYYSLNPFKNEMKETDTADEAMGAYQGYILNQALADTPRLPDAVQAEGNLSNLHVGLTYDARGNLYFSFSGNPLKLNMDPGKLSATQYFKKMVGGNISAVWLNQFERPSEEQAIKFFTGPSVTGTIGSHGLGVGESWSPGNGTATSIGISSPGFNFTGGTGTQVGKFRFHWTN